MNKYFILIFLGIFFFKNVEAQISYPQYESKLFLNEEDSNKLFLCVDNLNLFKNNEFFSAMEEGYTLAGSNLSTSFVYYPSEKSKFEVGAHFLKYYGLDNISKAIPTIRFHYKLTKNIDFVIGDVYNNTLANLVEPLYKKERLFTDQIKNGFQFMADYAYWQGDLFLNWENYIFHQDTTQEEFMAVFHNNFSLFPKNEHLDLNFLVTILGTHKGGQINNSTEKVYSTLNMLAGIEFVYNLNNKIGIGTKSYVMNYTNTSGSVFPFEDGFGFYPGIFSKIYDFEFYAGYWSGNQFMGLRGEEMFSSYSIRLENSEQYRKLLNLKLNYQKQLHDGILMGAKLELYKDMNLSTIDYAYSIYLRFNKDFKLAKIKE